MDGKMYQLEKFILSKLSPIGLYSTTRYWKV